MDIPTLDKSSNLQNEYFRIFPAYGLYPLVSTSIHIFCPYAEVCGQYSHPYMDMLVNFDQCWRFGSRHPEVVSSSPAQGNRMLM